MGMLAHSQITEEELTGKTSNPTNALNSDAQKAFDTMRAAALKDGIEDFNSFDAAYYSEKLKKAQYDLDEEYYRPYFEQQSVLNVFFY